MEDAYNSVFFFFKNNYAIVRQDVFEMLATLSRIEAENIYTHIL